MNIFISILTIFFIFSNTEAKRVDIFDKYKSGKILIVPGHDEDFIGLVY